MNITNTMCRLSDLTQEQIDGLVSKVNESTYIDFMPCELFIGFSKKEIGVLGQEWTTQQ
jgi:hypothetical protein